MNDAATWETAASPPGLGVRQAPLGAQAGTGQLSKGAVKQRYVFLQGWVALAYHHV